MTRRSLRLDWSFCSEFCSSTSLAVHRQMQRKDIVPAVSSLLLQGYAGERDGHVPSSRHPLHRVHTLVSSFWQANLAIEMALLNNVVRLEETYRRFDNYIQLQGTRVNLVETAQARESSLWAHFD